jgi:hypothetical protein
MVLLKEKDLDFIYHNFLLNLILNDKFPASISVLSVKFSIPEIVHLMFFLLLHRTCPSEPGDHIGPFFYSSKDLLSLLHSSFSKT